LETISTITHAGDAKLCNHYIAEWLYPGTFARCNSSDWSPHSKHSDKS